jgi:transcriptional regulator with XRE-family HTH domain
MSTALKHLILKAGKTLGSEYKLAQALGIPQSHISAWKSGVKTCTPPDRARLADIAKEDPVQELIRATLEATEGTKRGDQLKAVLGKSLRQIGGAAGSKIAGVFGLALGMAWSAAVIDIPRCIKRNPHSPKLS